MDIIQESINKLGQQVGSLTVQNAILLAQVEALKENIQELENKKEDNKDSEGENGTIH